jgi:hypothetical protein
LCRVGGEFVEGGFYHVYNRAARGVWVFEDEVVAVAMHLGRKTSVVTAWSARGARERARVREFGDTYGALDRTLVEALLYPDDQIEKDLDQRRAET